MLSLKEDIGWFQGQFKTEIEAELPGTPFSLDLFSAIAVQETRYIRSSLYKQLLVNELLKLWASDTKDAPRRSAFPKDKIDALVMFVSRTSRIRSQ
jgi:hypothetical protein